MTEFNEVQKVEILIRANIGIFDFKDEEGILHWVNELGVLTNETEVPEPDWNGTELAPFVAQYRIEMNGVLNKQISLFIGEQIDLVIGSGHNRENMLNAVVMGNYDAVQKAIYSTGITWILGMRKVGQQAIIDSTPVAQLVLPTVPVGVAELALAMKDLFKDQ